MIHEIKKVYENTIRIRKKSIKSDENGEIREYLCTIYKYIVSPKSFGVKENKRHWKKWRKRRKESFK